MNWRLAKSLETLRSQIDAAHPDRSKVSDGSIGDPAHQARKSDHDPNSAGVVTAIDVTHDPEHGVDGHVLSRQLVADLRTKYVIHAGQIYRTYKPELGWAAYHGPNAHFHHVHISVSVDANKYDDPSKWNLSDSPTPPARRVLKRGDSGPDVVELQAALGIPADTIDGVFGPATEHAVTEFQTANHLKIDGIAGPEVYALIYRQADTSAEVTS